MKKITVLIPLLSLLFFACSKQENIIQAESCVPQTQNPSALSYGDDSLVEISYSKKNCGILPMSRNNYWVYDDSIFNNGVFVRAQRDTLRYTHTWQTLKDGLIWWEGNINIGLPNRLYANDSSLFKLENRLFIPGIIDAKKELGIIAGDSIRYLTSFDDNARKVVQ